MDKYKTIKLNYENIDYEVKIKDKPNIVDSMTIDLLITEYYGGYEKRLNFELGLEYLKGIIGINEFPEGITREEQVEHIKNKFSDPKSKIDTMAWLKSSEIVATYNKIATLKTLILSSNPDITPLLDYKPDFLQLLWEKWSLLSDETPFSQQK